MAAFIGEKVLTGNAMFQDAAREGDRQHLTSRKTRKADTAEHALLNCPRALSHAAQVQRASVARRLSDKSAIRFCRKTGDHQQSSAGLALLSVSDRP
jgi:hypothetical protein